MKINKPKIPLNSTPIRTRDVQAGYYSNQGLTPTRQYENGMHLANLSPNKLNATKKPLSQKGYQSNQVQQVPNIQMNQRRDSQANRPLAMLSKKAMNECMNHPNKQGVYKIYIQDDQLFCCHQCSINLSNQGFNPEKIINTTQINVVGANSILSSRRQSNSNFMQVVPLKAPTPSLNQHVTSNYNDFTLQIDPSLSQDPRSFELQQFIEQCKQTLISFDENIEGFSKVQQHYVHQQQNIQSFYDAMIEYLKHIKTEHLNSIDTQARKYVQIAEIESAELLEEKQKIEAMLLDISQNANDIIANIDQESFVQCMDQYRNTIQRHNHRVEEQRSTFEQMFKIQPQELEIKLQYFRTTVNDFFKVKQSQNRIPQRNANVISRNIAGVGMINSNGINNMYHLRRNSNTCFNQNNTIQGFNNIMNPNVMNSHGIGNISGVLGMMKNNNNFNINTLPKANTNAPFRNLFGDDGTAQSPQFKNI